MALFYKIVLTVLFFQISQFTVLSVNQLDNVFIEHLNDFLSEQNYPNYKEVLNFLTETNSLKNTDTVQSVVNWRVFQDLSILNGDEFSPGISIINVLPNAPKTMLGNVQLAQTLAFPLCEGEDLLKRKNFIDSFFTPENQHAYNAIEMFIANHDQCLEFLFRNHAKDDQSCLNPKHGFYWSPVAKTKGFLHSASKFLSKNLKLHKLGSLPFDAAKPFKFLPLGKAKNGVSFLLSCLWPMGLFKKIDPKAFDHTKKGIMLRFIFRGCWLTFFIGMDIQSIAEMLDNIFNVKLFEVFRNTVGDPRGSSDCLDSPGIFNNSRNTNFTEPPSQDSKKDYITNLLKKKLRPWFRDRTFLTTWDQAYFQLKDCFSKIIHREDILQSLKVMPGRTFRFARKTFKPPHAIIKFIILLYLIIDTFVLAHKLNRSLIKDLNLFLPLIEFFYQLIPLIKPGINDSLLQLDSQFQAQFLELSQSKALADLNKEAKSFKPSAINFVGNLKTYKMLFLARADLTKLLCFYGQLEVFLCANEMAKDKRFVRPEFINSKLPYLEAQELWSVKLGFDQSVKNSFKIGLDPEQSLTEKNYQSNAVTTGANAGGKSFFIREVLESALLAQSLLIAPCSKMKLTPFAQLYSFIKKEDDPAKKLSLHWCECAEVGRFNNQIESLPQDKFALAIIDELFSGTAQAKTGLLFENFINWANDRPNLIGFYTTHATKSLEERDFFNKTGAKTKFYRFGVNRDAQRQFLSYKYRLEEGVATAEDDTALDVARMAGMRII